MKFPLKVFYPDKDGAPTRGQMPDGTFKMRILGVKDQTELDGLLLIGWKVYEAKSEG